MCRVCACGLRKCPCLHGVPLLLDVRWHASVALRCSLLTAGGVLLLLLLCRPTLLLLDEPTNHLDLETCVWLEHYLADYPHILVLISHSQDFLNGVCTNVLHLSPTKKLEVYKGNYASYVKTKDENEIQQEKQYKKQQGEIKDIKRFIASCGTFANAVKQAQSRQKVNIIFELLAFFGK